jgi:L-aspartate oxidase
MKPEFIRERFPTVYRHCLDAGIDITAGPIPVVPAAHYSCGGVLVDDRGRTSIRNLYAVGEVSCTGVHGANRLASTSLLEGLVWGVRAAEDIAASDPPRPAHDVPPWEEADGSPPDPVLIHQDLRTIQDTMWNYVGLVRNAPRMARALRDLSHLWQEVESFYRDNRITDDLIGLRNSLQTAWVVARSAWQNRQSRGAHYRDDAAAKAVSGTRDSAASYAPLGEF